MSGPKLGRAGAKFLAPMDITSDEQIADVVASEYQADRETIARDASMAIIDGFDGCTTYRICFQELQAFEADLHAHVHLENNLLFPKAKALAAPRPA